MTVNPGFGGQKFIPAALDKLRALRALIRRETLLSVDGGLDSETIPAAARAGAEVFVVGSAIFDSHDYREAMERLQLAAGGAAVSAPVR